MKSAEALMRETKSQRKRQTYMTLAEVEEDLDHAKEALWEGDWDRTTENLSHARRLIGQAMKEF
jgi:flagellin-specific chaperone FliS